MIVVDRRPSMALYDRGLPWLSKPSAVARAAEAIAFAAVAARAELGYADEVGGRAHILTPGALAPRHILDRARKRSFDASPASLRDLLNGVANRRAELPQSSFVFVLSDYLNDVPDSTWTVLRRGRLDVVPVIVQDPVWEQHFPRVPGVLIPFAGVDGDSDEALVRLTAAECARLSRENEERLDRLSSRFRLLGFDPIVLGTSDPTAVDRAFLQWAERRRRRRRRR